jgi:hypothetical protein
VDVKPPEAPQFDGANRKRVPNVRLEAKPAEKLISELVRRGENGSCVGGLLPEVKPTTALRSSRHLVKVV